MYFFPIWFIWTQLQQAILLSNVVVLYNIHGTQDVLIPNRYRSDLFCCLWVKYVSLKLVNQYATNKIPQYWSLIGVHGTYSS